MSNNIKNSLCYHCGEKGHYTGRCPLNAGPQTTIGKAVWAKRNQERGHDWPYNATFYVQLCDKFEAAERARLSTSRADKHKKRDVVTIDDDKSGTEELYDDDD